MKTSTSKNTPSFLLPGLTSAQLRPLFLTCTGQTLE